MHDSIYNSFIYVKLFKTHYTSSPNNRCIDPRLLNILKIFLLFCLILLLPVFDIPASASAAFKGLHPPMEIEPELLGPPEGMVFVRGGCFGMGGRFGGG